jgi:hypothetical protein
MTVSPTIPPSNLSLNREPNREKPWLAFWAGPICPHHDDGLAPPVLDADGLVSLTIVAAGEPGKILASFTQVSSSTPLGKHGRRVAE